MDFCNWVRQIDNTYTCKICGFNTKLENAVRECKKSPSLLTKIGNFIPALTHHVMTGMKTCTQEEIGNRLAICKECPLFVPNNKEKTSGICSAASCGCNIKDSQGFLNKLYWADSRCPLGKWDEVSGSGV